MEIANAANQEQICLNASPAGMVTSTPPVTGSQPTVFKGRRIGSMIGQGGYGQVYKAVNVRTGAKEVCKVVSNNLAGQTEMDIMRDLPEHPNIIEHIYSTSSPRSIYIFMQYGGNMTLFHYQKAARWLDGTEKRHGCFDSDTALDLFADIANAVLHLHDHGICHLDIKPHNIVVSEEGTPRLIDFSCADYTDRQHEKLVGTLPYIAPEVLHPPADGYDGRLADSFSMGVLLFDMINGVDAMFKALKWNEESSNELMKNTARRASELKVFLSAMTAETPRSGAKDFDLITGMHSMLSERVTERPLLEVACELLALVPTEASEPM